MGVGSLCRPSGPGNLNSSLVLLKEDTHTHTHRIETAVGLGFRDVRERLWDLRRRERVKQRLGVASWHSGKATKMDADDQLEADWGTF